VLLSPQHGHLRKREAADLTTELFRGHLLGIPIVSAPMDSVTESEMAVAMSIAGGFGIIHRFMTVDEQVAQFGIRPQPFTNKGAALGVNEGYERFDRLYDAGVRVFCVDIAHAHHETVADFLSNMPKRDDARIIAGNVATNSGARFLCELGVHAVKVGIGPGAACSTRLVTGFGVPQLTAINEVSWIVRDSFSHVRIIADGGIKNSGDIVKALAAGADTVMLGRLLAGADESPHPGLYWGMASHRVNSHHAPEGIEGSVPRTGTLRETLKPLLWGLRSGISYGGGSTIKELRENAEFIRVSSLASIESGTRLHHG